MALPDSDCGCDGPVVVVVVIVNVGVCESLWLALLVSLDVIDTLGVIDSELESE